MRTFHVMGEGGDMDEYSGDIRRIRLVLQGRGYECSAAQAKALWEKYSESMSAGWMGLPERDDELFYAVEPYVVEDED